MKTLKGKACVLPLLLIVLLLALLFSAIGLRPARADGVDWTEYPGNPVFDPADPARAYYPCVIYDTDQFSGHGDAYYYKMWYGDTESDPYEWVVYSDDGINWENQEPLTGLNPVGYHAKVLYDAGGFGGGSYRYKIWYWDSTGAVLYSINAIRTADSVDGVNWENDAPLTQDATHTLIDSTGSDWNRGSYGPIEVLYNPSAGNTGTNPFDYSYAMYYDGTTGGLQVTGLAYSSDGNHWTRYHQPPYEDAPVLDRGGTGEWDSDYSSMGTVVRESAGVWHYWYSGGGPASGGNQGIGYASSSDGINWTRDPDNPLLYYTDGVAYRDVRTYTPSVIYSPDLFNGHGDSCHYKMWITGRTNAPSTNYTIGYFSSPILYFINASVSGTGGSVSPLSQVVGEGDSASVNITPETGYVIASITDNGVPRDIDNPYVIDDVQEGHAVVVTFAEQVAEPTLAKASDPPGDVVRGQVITYTLRAGNDGSANATGCVLTDAVPDYADYVSHSTTLNGVLIPDAGGTTPLQAGLVVNSPGEPAGTIAPGEEAVVTFRVQVAGDLPLTGYVRNTGTLSATGLDPVIASVQNDSGGLPATWYFAEGSTQPGFDEFILLANMGDSDMDVTVTYLTEGGVEKQFVHRVPAHSRRTVVAGAEMPGESGLAAIVSGQEGLICERTLYFDHSGVNGGHQAIGANATSLEMFFAEGYTGGEGNPFEEWILVLNPDTAAAELEVTYLFPGGATKVDDYTVDGRSRLSINVDGAVGEGQEVSAQITSTNGVAVVAERAMYFDYHGEWGGGHIGKAATGPRFDWYLAEGFTGSDVSLFDEYILVSNNNDAENDFTVTFMFPDGSTQDFDYTAQAQSRFTVVVDSTIGEDRMNSARVAAEKPVVVERAMYFDYNLQLKGGHNSAGATSPASEMYFAEGYTGNADSQFQTWLLVQNTDASAKTVVIDYVLGSGDVITREIALPGNSRTTVNANQEVGGGSSVEFSMSVRSKDGSACLVAERAMYFDFLGSFGRALGGDDVLGY